MKNNHSYVAAFDLDKTLLSVNSSRLVVKASRKNGYMNKRDFFMAIVYSFVYKFDLKDANEIVLSMLKWLKGLKEVDVKALSQELVVPEMIRMIRPEMVKELDYHRRKNARLLLLSSALPYLCDPVSSYLKMDDVVCSSIEVENGYFTGRANRKLVFGQEKAVRMQEYCEAHNFSLDHAWYYGDAYTDRFILDVVGNPVCVKPEIKLGWMARKKGWRVV